MVSSLRCLAGLALLAGLAASDAPARLETGPWQTWDGSVREIAVRLAPGSGGAGLVAELDGERLPSAPLLRHPPAGGLVAAWRLRDGDAHRYAITAGTQRREGRLAAIPGEDASARLAIASPLSWPRQEELDRLATHLGGPVQAVLVPGGHGLDRALGQGGWEADLPLLVVPDATDGERDALCGAGAPQGLRWGRLGLAACTRADAAAAAISAIGGDWAVLVQGASAWDPGLLADAARQDVQDLAPLMRLGAAIRLPLVVAGGNLAGVLTGPLTADDHGDLELRPGGCRYLVAASAYPPGPLPPAIDRPFDRRTQLGLLADDDRLVLVLLPDGDQETLLAWPRWNGQEPAPAGGWGGGDPAALKATLLEGLPAEGFEPPAERAAATRTAAESLAAMARPRLRQGGEPDGESLRRLASLLAGEGQAPPPWLRRAILHLLSDDDYRAGRVVDATTLPAWARRETVLRAMAQARPIPSWWSGAVAADDDPVLVLAAIRLSERHPGPELLAPLVERLRRQAEGRTAVDTDPLLQSRLTATVFDSPYLSPTPLRSIALGLRTRLSPIGIAPAQRFLARHGEERPAGRR